jgi:hypothetical protein
MAKVLLVEPHKVLQQALALSLFPEHDVRVVESIDGSAVSALADVELLIVDAAALREKDQFTAELRRALEASKLAVLWIDESGDPPKRERLAAIARPVDSATLQSVVAALLPGAAAKPPSKQRDEQKTEKIAAKEAAESPLIDLVEVVEEVPGKAK